MATSKEFHEYVTGQFGDLPFTTKSMFGEYGIYYGGKFVGYICDDTVFVKPLPGIDPELLKGLELGKPHPGAKTAYPTVNPDEAETMVEIFQAAAAVAPKPKKK